ncbi:uncharacterized protein LOC129757915 [Uranotaenia lowii]|uniref:uncharacterized protein LOC129749754 n=1 Tax=Uranotaenia lowii TaxID=190385 RepID=UPI002478A8B8|nr:uncharacterized protein LOC129749754 [Uranotaenia lowii]XP_055611283.1 uncharacterized protein LOC129757915 [Uranotaenia lowii]
MEKRKNKRNRKKGTTIVKKWSEYTAMAQAENNYNNYDPKQTTTACPSASSYQDATTQESPKNSRSTSRTHWLQPLSNLDDSCMEGRSIETVVPGPYQSDGGAASEDRKLATQLRRCPALIVATNRS